MIGSLASKTILRIYYKSFLVYVDICKAAGVRPRFEKTAIGLIRELGRMRARVEDPGFLSLLGI